MAIFVDIEVFRVEGLQRYSGSQLHGPFGALEGCGRGLTLNWMLNIFLATYISTYISLGRFYIDQLSPSIEILDWWRLGDFVAARVCFGDRRGINSIDGRLSNTQADKASCPNTVGILELL